MSLAGNPATEAPCFLAALIQSVIVFSVTNGFAALCITIISSLSAFSYLIPL